MYRIDLTESEQSTLRNALCTAAARYDEDAKTFRDLKPQLIEAEKNEPNAMRMIHSGACDRLAEQFDYQAKEVRELMDKIDDAEER